MAEFAKPRVIGFNHVALEVGDIDEALAFYGRIFRFELRGKTKSMAFIDLGDQFIALQKGRRQPADDGRHFGLVVDDKEVARKALKAAGVTLLDGPIFGTPGVTEWRSLVTTIFSSPRHPMCCVAWA
jgi:catechol 2,3-dioxygenase-like lactoylglutathione lyase family enzyme